MRMRGLRIIFVLLITLPSLGIEVRAASGAPDVGKAALRVRSLALRGDSQVLVQRAKHEVKIYALASKSLGKGAAVGLAKKAKGVNLRFRGETMELVYDIGSGDNPRSVIQSLPVASNSEEKSAFKLESYRMFSKFPESYWPDFLSHCISIGLQSYELNQEQDVAFIQLTFGHPLPEPLPVGSLRLHVPNSAQAHLRIARGFVQTSTNSEPGVLIIHDPHASLAGVSHLVHGLEVMLESIPADKIKFLVEGFNPNPTDSIPLNGLDRVVAANGGSPGLVFSLARRYLIDSAMAYRLLSGRSIDSVAIDSNELLAKDTPEAHGATKDAFNLIPELNRQASTATGDMKALLMQALAFMTADIREASGGGIVRYWRGGAQALGALATGMEDKALASKLKRLSDGYKINANAFAVALARDTVMAEKIASNVKSAPPDRLHVAFIGSFHTPGILRILRASGIGATVIEPLDGDQVSIDEQARFDKAVFGRVEYLRSLRSERHKGGVGPTIQEVEQFYRPFLASQRSERTAVATERPADIGVVDLAKLGSFFDKYGIFGAVDIGFGGGKPPSPPLTGVFAVFESGDGNGHRARLTVLNPKDDSWKAESRYLALQQLFLAPKPRFEGEQRRLRATFISASVDGQVRTYACIHDGASKKSYLVEGNKAAVASIMALESGFQSDLHVNVAEINAIHDKAKDFLGGES